MEHECESFTKGLTDNCECCCHCEGESHCNHDKPELPEIFDENDIDRIVTNLNDWD